MEKVTTVVLAAGEGKRMKSQTPKVLHRICGRSLLGHVLAAVEKASQQKIVVVGHGAQQVKEAFGDKVQYAYQHQQLGTGHAVMQAEQQIPRAGDVFILCGDTPLLSAEVMEKMLLAHKQSGVAATVLTAVVPDAYGYGRIIRTEAGDVVKIVEEKDATEGERTVREINTGTYLFQAEALLDSLGDLDNDNAQGEYYLTDCIALLISRGLKVGSYCLEDYRMALGVNDRSQLAEAAKLLRERINGELMAGGVTIHDPATTYVDVDVRVGEDTELLPNTYLKGATEIGARCVIGPGTEITECQIGSCVTVRHSVLNRSVLEDNVTVGPFAHLRPETVLRSGVKVGDFVEIKKSDIGSQSKVPHLSYVGDARVGQGVNLGAGTIVVNYDGKNKHVTEIGPRAFIGCNSNLVAPVSIGKGAFVAAGSTITKDVPDGSLSLARPKQVNKEGLAGRFIRSEKKDES
ncbi:bifunctional UDP-N-acetylglucosamine diphosphorylase/glucosamine-1-phosphate N-acetyltransferase GlmU [Dethiobacter alkaliphilus]|uniref:Bifunctional protein GlmU n=1 Tax=Dethiobacter alkaliphilus AHT 1 TaxID=555088 RepID=C0GJC8_DETAL|nr:bifunctional UDP-N-acetylglucosamine diphosphorylase/glucosamine-1-phosphate N-acetyltransferase GlmU [Dethiobacter alkaliphilus]EEG76613.1 UDP-N-acetylglucosamine pyrophosphorylase [Dethiobacter alkaliphilus AHT 1]